MRLDQDWHIHTHRSKCGKPDNTVPAIAAKLDRCGVKFAGLADHIDTQEQRDWFMGVVAENRAEVGALDGSCRFLVGTEATMLAPGRCALDAALARELDFVLVACNHYHLDCVENPSTKTAEAYANHHLDMILGAASLGFVTSVSHPFTLLYGDGIDADEVLRSYSEERLTEVLRTAAEADMAFEISPYRAGNAHAWFRDLIQEARRHGTRFTLGSDAHTLDHVGYEPRDDRDPRAICESIGLTDDDLRPPPAV
jgi:histidinol phosphatase-like PHP family hydrolase